MRGSESGHVTGSPPVLFQSPRSPPQLTSGPSPLYHVLLHGFSSKFLVSSTYEYRKLARESTGIPVARSDSSAMKKIPWIKYISLVTLVLQTTLLVLLLRYSRTTDSTDKRYLSSTAVVISESLKLCTCLLLLFIENGSTIAGLMRALFEEVFGSPRETFKLLIPAALYTIQNNLLFIALSNLDAATYQVTYQMKILTTALFSVFMLHKKLYLSQWVSLVVLMVGVILVQWPQDDESVSLLVGREERDTSSSEESREHFVPHQNKAIGLASVMVCSISSGFSGVYFEKLIKYTSTSLWIRNFQLSIFGFILGLVAAFAQDLDSISSGGFLQGYTSVTWIVILLQAFGGLVVATVVKYADNILKGFATSISIVLSTLLSYYLLGDFQPTLIFGIGATIVMLATILYSS